MRIEPHSRQDATLHLEDGRELKMQVKPHALVLAWDDQEVVRLHFRTLRSANSPEDTPLFSLESVEASPEWKAQLTPWLQSALAWFSQYHGGRIILAKTLATAFSPQPELDPPA